MPTGETRPVGESKANLVPLSLLALRLGLPVRWLREEATAGRLPSLRVGDDLLFDLEAVTHTLRERARTDRTARRNQREDEP